MTQANQYSRYKNFADDSPSATDHSSINAELDRISVSINQLRENASIIQSDDGSIRSGLIKVESLSQEVINLITGADVLTIQGPKGDVGESFSADVRGNESERFLFREREKGFSYLSIDTGFLFFKISSSPGDWSHGYAFGKGPSGESAYSEWINAGNIGTKQQFLNSLKGEKGDRGDDGVITSIDQSTKTIPITGKNQINIRLAIVGGQLQIIVA